MILDIPFCLFFKIRAYQYLQAASDIYVIFLCDKKFSTDETLIKSNAECLLPILSMTKIWLESDATFLLVAVHSTSIQDENFISLRIPIFSPIVDDLCQDDTLEAQLSTKQRKQFWVPVTNLNSKRKKLVQEPAKPTRYLPNHTLSYQSAKISSTAWLPLSSPIGACSFPY